jgi:hypothetical protein
MYRILMIALPFVLLAGAAPAQHGKHLRDMSPTERRQFIQNGGLAGKCKYQRCYEHCMERRGIEQFSNAKCAQRCARRGCV